MTRCGLVFVGAALGAFGMGACGPSNPPPAQTAETAQTARIAETPAPRVATAQEARPDASVPEELAKAPDPKTMGECQRWVLDGQPGYPPMGCVDRSDIPPVDLSNAAVVDGGPPPPPPRGNVKLSQRTDVFVSDFERVIAGLRARVRTCYRRALDANPALKAGDVSLRFRIEPNGEVSGAAVTKHHPDFPQTMTVCLTRVFNNAQFSAPGGKGSNATVDAHFTPD